MADAGHEQWLAPAGRMVWLRGLAAALLEDAAPLQAVCLVAAETAAGLPILAELFHGRDSSGVIGAILLADSHLTIPHVAEGAYRDPRRVRWPQERNSRTKARAVYGLLKECLQARQGEPAPGQSRRSRGPGCRARPR